MKLFRFLSIVLGGSFYFTAHAQRCGFEHDALIMVKLIEEESGAFQHHVKLSLVYGNNQAIETHSNQVDQGVYCSEPYIFWENTTNKIPKQTCANTHMVRTSFAGLGNAYLCVVPLETMNFNLATLLGFDKPLFLSRNEDAETVFSKLQDSLFWHIRIEDQGNKHKKAKPTLIRIPLHAAISICKEHIAEGYSYNHNFISKRTITILHTKQDQYQLVNTLPAYDYYIFPVRAKTYSDDNHPVEESSQGISRILVVHDSSGQVTQTITPDSENVFFTSTEFVTWPISIFQHRRVFRINKETSIQNKQTKRSTSYYSFNHMSKRYEPDEELNQMDSIKFDETNGRLIGFKNIGDVTNIYHYIDKAWVLQLSKNNPKRVPDTVSSNLTPKPKARIQCERSQRNLPMQSFSAYTKTVQDTFWVMNTGDGEASLKLYPSVYYSWEGAKNSDRSQTLKPKERAAIIYERSFEQETKPTPNPRYVKQPLEFITDFCMIQYQKEDITLSMSYPIVKEQTTTSKEEHGITHYSYPYNFPPYPTPTHTQVEYHVLTDSNGYILSYGKQLSNGTKIGTWVMTEHTPQGDQITNHVEQHAKLLTLNVQGDTITRCQLQVVSAWNSYTIEPDTNSRLLSSHRTIIIPPTISYINIKKKQQRNTT